MLIKQALVVQQFIDGFHYRLCQLVSWFTLIMVFLTFLIVVLRYGFNLGWIAMQESVMYLHVVVFLLGAAHTLKVNEHVRVDIFYRKMSRKKQALVNVFGTLFLLMPVNFLVFILSFNYVVNAWGLLESSPEAGGLPLVFLLKSFILVFAITMNLQGLAELIRNLFLLKAPAELSPQEQA